MAYVWQDGETITAEKLNNYAEEMQEGFSPEVTITETTTGHNVKITDREHPTGQTFSVNNGAKGDDGTDGVSPQIIITTITGGHQIKIIDADHPSGQTFNVMDGSGSGDMQASTYDPDGDVADAGGIPDYVASHGISLVTISGDIGSLTDEQVALLKKEGTVILQAGDFGSYYVYRMETKNDTLGQYTYGSLDTKNRRYLAVSATQKTFGVSVRVLGEQSISFTVTLDADDWSNNELTLSDIRFNPYGYDYIITPTRASHDDYQEANVKADDVTTAGQIKFYCDTTPTTDITLNVLKVEVA